MLDGVERTQAFGQVDRACERDGLEQGHPKGETVAKSVIDATLAPEFFRAHVGERSHQGRRARRRQVVQIAGQAEVRQEDAFVVLALDQDV